MGHNFYRLRKVYGTCQEDTLFSK